MWCGFLIAIKYLDTQLWLPFPFIHFPGLCHGTINWNPMLKDMILPIFMIILLKHTTKYNVIYWTMAYRIWIREDVLQPLTGWPAFLPTCNEGRIFGDKRLFHLNLPSPTALLEKLFKNEGYLKKGHSWDEIYSY